MAKQVDLVAWAAKRNTYESPCLVEKSQDDFVAELVASTSDLGNCPVCVNCGACLN
ncbi:MAG: hypothetical protein HYU86_07370 [Chloroflexi bacterium]|nr:hypothetical protein [Chloroflexota bacterium]